MRKFLFKVMAFIVAVVIIDFLFGMYCDYMYAHSKGGDTYKINYAITECNADMLIMGSSRANHHYNPTILSDSLGISVYNLGIDGSGVILMDGFYRLITQRYVPKYIIYELTPSFDFQQYAGDANNTRYLSQLKPYYKANCISNIFEDVDSRERLKLISGLYRYNTSFLNLIRFYFKDSDGNYNGFSPLIGCMNDFTPKSETSFPPGDSLKIHYLRQFIRDCKLNGTKLFFVISPRYGESSNIEYQPGLKICRQEGCEVIDFYCDSSFVSNKRLFKDSYHLNSEGADLFTKKLISEIKKGKLI